MMVERSLRWISLAICIQLVVLEKEKDVAEPFARANLYLHYLFAPHDGYTSPAAYQGEIHGIPPSQKTLDVPFFVSIRDESEYSKWTYKQHFIDHIISKEIDEMKTVTIDPMCEQERDHFYIKQVYLDRGQPATLPAPSLCIPSYVIKIPYRLQNREGSRPFDFKSFHGEERWNGDYHKLVAYLARDMHRSLKLDDDLLSLSRLPDGAVSLSNPPYSENMKYENYAATYVWATIRYNGLPRPLPFMFNIDYLLPHQNSTGENEHTEYKPIHDIKPVATHDHIQMTLEWEKWSCCSACCCSFEDCGRKYNMEGVERCSKVESFKRRRGFYVYKLKKDQSHPDPVLSALMKREPYSTSGIPVASTLWFSFKSIKEKLDEKFIVANTSTTFYEVQSCEKDAQMSDCDKWRACHANEAIKDGVKNEDICSLFVQEELVVINTGDVFHVAEDTMYRFQVDTVKYPEANDISWLHGSTTIPTMTSDEACDKITEPMVHPNGRDLIIPKVSKAMTRKTFTAIWGSGQLSIQLSLRKKADSVDKFGPQLIMWGGLILGFLLLVTIFACVVHRLKSARAKEAFKSSKRSQAMSEHTSKASTKASTTSSRRSADAPAVGGRTSAGHTDILTVEDLEDWQMANMQSEMTGRESTVSVESATIGFRESPNVKRSNQDSGGDERHQTPIV